MLPNVKLPPPSLRTPVVKPVLVTPTNSLQFSICYSYIWPMATGNSAETIIATIFGF